MAKNKDLYGQISDGAKKERLTLLVRDHAVKMFLSVEAKVNVADGFAYVSVPASEGFYAVGKNYELGKATPGSEAEAAYFPERAKELAEREAKIKKLMEEAKSLGMTLMPSYGRKVDIAPRTRAPRGSKPPRVPKTPPAKGDKFTSVKDGSAWSVKSNEAGMIKLVNDATKEVYDVKYSGIFWRWWNKA